MRRSQVALEFLLTYGWAILASMIAIGALAYFGMTNPTRVLPDKCLFSNNFQCSDHIIQAPNVVKVRLVNGLGQTIYSPSATVANIGSGSSACTLPAVSEWAPDDTLELSCPVGGATFIANDKAKAKITLNYKKTPSGYTQVSLGEVYSTVQ